METENVTLAVPKDLLRRAERVAARRNITLSCLLTKALDELLMYDERYEAARRRHLKMLERGFDLGTGGTPTWRRDDLHSDC